MTLTDHELGSCLVLSAMLGRTEFAQFAQACSLGDLQTIREAAQRLAIWVDQEIQIKVAE